MGLPQQNLPVSRYPTQRDASFDRSNRTRRLAVRDAATRWQVRDAVISVYAAVQKEIDARRPLCVISGRCCRFEEYGHRLYVTTIELAVFTNDLERAAGAATLAAAPSAKPGDESRCLPLPIRKALRRSSHQALRMPDVLLRCDRRRMEESNLRTLPYRTQGASLSSSSVGRSFKLCTARSMRPAYNASSISFS